MKRTLKDHLNDRFWMNQSLLERLLEIAKWKIGGYSRKHLLKIPYKPCNKWGWKTGWRHEWQDMGCIKCSKIGLIIKEGKR